MPLSSTQSSPGGNSPPASSHSCSCQAKPTQLRRNLVVGIDGTANKFGQKNTNVVKLLEAIDCDTVSPKQDKYYLGGIGTRPKVTHVFKRMSKAAGDKLDMVIAWNMAEGVKDAYGWLAEEYQEGDRIYLFGFSRGAYQVRILAWMIYEVGLIKKPSERQIGSAYDHFEAVMLRKPSACHMAQEFKNMFSWQHLGVHFIGVWDTVSSVGFQRGDVSLSVSSAADHACHIRHALALDERRVRFMPEYFLEMNSLDLCEFTKNYPPKSDSGNHSNDVTLPDEEVLRGARPESINAKQPRLKKVWFSGSHSDVGGNSSNDDDVLKGAAENVQLENTNANQPTPPSRVRKLDNIKEVWFAGCHSDVGGKHHPGKPSHAGKVSLIWMRREAVASGLVLKPEEIFCTAEDLDLGTTHSMSPFWRLIEILPLQHQVSYSGSGENAHKWHLCTPRRIIPGQKIHASVQFAGSYIPRATFGKEIGNPFSTNVPTSYLQGIWERDTIDQQTYEVLFDKVRQAGTEAFYLHTLLFELKLSRGQSPIAITPDQRETLNGLITTQSGLVRLAAIAASAEALNPSDGEITLPDEVTQEAGESLKNSLKSEQDCRRAVIFLPPLTKHTKLQISILTDEVVHSFLRLLDGDIKVPKKDFVLVLHALSSLVHYCPKKIVGKLEQSDGKIRKNRVLMILDSNDPSHLTVALGIVISLAPKVSTCSKAKSRLHELAGKHQGRVGLLATMALAVLYLQEPCARCGLGSHQSWTQKYLPDQSTSNSTVGSWMWTGGSALYQMLFTGLLRNNQKKFNKAFLDAADGRDKRARTALIFTLLQMREANMKLTAHPLGGSIMDVFVKQLQFRDSALLAAYALTRCLTKEEFADLVDSKPSIAGYIVNMVRLDYFDEAIGPTEGFTILQDLMRNKALKQSVLRYNITTLLEQKLGAGTPRGMRTGLIYLNIFQDHHVEHSLTQELVDRAMVWLRTGEWKTQKAGVAILCSLAQIWFGVEALKVKICQVIGLLLPPVNSDTQQRSYNPPASLLGPACVIHVWAGNKILREEISRTRQYGELKHDYLFGKLIGGKETPFWQVNTPTRDDVLEVINQMIKSVDIRVKSLTDPGFILPHISHWERVGRPVVRMIVVPPAAIGGAAVVISGALVMAPVVAYRILTDSVGRLWQRCRQDAIIRNLRIPDSQNSPSDRLHGNTGSVIVGSIGRVARSLDCR